MSQFTFFLAVNDFGVKYVGKEDVTCIFDSEQQYYKPNIDWESNIYFGLTLYWDYKKPWTSPYQGTYKRPSLSSNTPAPKIQKMHHSIWNFKSYRAKVKLSKEKDSTQELLVDSIQLLQPNIKSSSFMVELRT